MGGFSNFAISFSIISVLTGAVLLYGYGLKLAGPVINTLGWPGASLFTLCVAASMAELASAYPTAGGPYFWAFPPRGRRRGGAPAGAPTTGPGPRPRRPHPPPPPPPHRVRP